MSRTRFAAALVLSAPLATLLGSLAVGCGDDEVFKAEDAGGFDSGAPIDAGPNPQNDGGDGSAPSGCGNATGAPARLLLSANGTAQSEIVAFNLADKKVDGRFGFPGSLGASSSFGTDPYVVEQAKDVVARMNAQRPWEAIASWNVQGDDAKDGGDPNAQPIAIIVPACTNGYVLRFNRNKIAVIDTNKNVADGGAVESYVDLTSLVQAEDKDGLVDMTSAVYVASKKRIYVLLGNYDRTTIGPPDYALLCKNTKATLIAIDTVTGQLAPLGGTGPGGSIALEGYNPAVSAPMAYDAARDRLLVFQGGCTADVGGVPTMTKRSVEEVNLATNQAKTLLPLNDKGFPGSMVIASGNRAALTFFFPNQAFFWDPSRATLGAQIPGSLDYVTHDGKGNLLGARRVPVDGGANTEIVSIPFAENDGGTVDASAITKIGENPFSSAAINAGYLGGAEVWPRP